MSASFEEKSVWIQLVVLAGSLGGYLLVAQRMHAAGVTALPAYAALFMVSVLVMVIVLVAGLIVAAVASGPEGRDERDRLIGWRSESNASWVLGAGVFGAITCMLFSLDNLWVAHLLLLSMYLSELLGLVLRLVYYRGGV